MNEPTTDGPNYGPGCILIIIAIVGIIATIIAASPS
jgi:hypothetical protein